VGDPVPGSPVDRQESRRFRLRPGEQVRLTIEGLTAKTLEGISIRDPKVKRRNGFREEPLFLFALQQRYALGGVRGDDLPTANCSIAPRTARERAAGTTPSFDDCAPAPCGLYIRLALPQGKSAWNLATSRLRKHAGDLAARERFDVAFDVGAVGTQLGAFLLGSRPALLRGTGRKSQW